MGFFSSIKNGVQRAALVSQCAIAGVNLKKAETGDAVEQYKYGRALLVGKTPLRQNKEEAVEWLRKSAEQGNDQAQKLFGDCLMNGDGVAADAASAVEWYKKASAQGEVEAHKALAECYATGTGVAQDLAAAQELMVRVAGSGDVEYMLKVADTYESGIGTDVNFEKCAGWLKRAVDKDSAEAQFRLALMTSEGKGVEKDEAAAVALFEKAAKQNHVEAQYRLANCLRDAIGFDASDEAKAIYWYHKAATAGHEQSKGEISRIVTEWAKRAPGLIVDVDPNYFEPFEVAANAGNAGAQYCVARFYANKTAGKSVVIGREKTVFELDEKAANGGNVYAQYMLGLHYREGEGVEKNLSKAVTWLEKAADGNSLSAMRTLGEMFSNGIGVEQDSTRAFGWFEKAANLGDVEAQRKTADCYSAGQGVSENKLKALEYYTMAANGGDVVSMKNLAMIYRDGVGVEKSLSTMVEWLVKAANAGDGDSMLLVGDSYADGTGVAQDDAAAAAWYGKGAEKNVPKAMVKYSNCLRHGIGMEVDNDEAATWCAKALKAGAEGIAPIIDEIVADWRDKRPEAFKDISRPIYDLFTDYAEQGNAAAQYCKGACLLIGAADMNANFDKAGETFEKSAEQGNVLAQFYAGSFRERRKAEPDYGKAAFWYGKAADQDFSEAYFPAGWNKYHANQEKGDNSDLPNTVKWLTKALDSGSTFAAYYLGKCYEKGLGVEADAGRAFQMYTLFCNSENVEVPDYYRKDIDPALAEAQYRIGLAYANGNGVDSNPQAAIEWYLKASDRGHSSAEYELGLSYYNGFYNAEDHATALEWFVRSARHQCVSAMEMAAKCYDEGDGTEQDPVEALNWFLCAAANREDGCQEDIVRLTDIAVAMNERQFSRRNFEVLEEAANQKVLNAQYYVGYMYCPLSDQHDVEHNTARGFDLLKAAAKRDHYEAAFWVGECYYQGTAKNLLGFSTSSEGKAEDWFLKAQRSRDANIRATAVSRIEQIRAERQEREERELQKEIAKSQIRANDAMASQARSARDLNRSIANKMEQDRHPHCG